MGGRGTRADGEEECLVLREDAAEVTEAPLDRGVLGGVRLLVVVGSLFDERV